MKTILIKDNNDFPTMYREEENAQENKESYSVIIKNGITAIPKEAFKDCLKLKNIVIPDSVTEIGDHAFEDCGIEAIDIPDSVTSIGWGAFKGCYWLSHVRLPARITEIPGECFAGACGIEAINIPNSVTEIGTSAFECTWLKSIIIPDSVTKIGDKTFNKCALLTDIKLSKNIKLIPYRCFENCHRLEYIEIPEDVKEIERSFQYCRNLTEIIIPDSVNKIWYGTFKGTLIFPEDVPERFRNENTFPKSTFLGG